MPRKCAKRLTQAAQDNGEPKALAATANAPDAAGIAASGPRRYRVIVDRMPYWKRRPQPLNALIEGDSKDPAIRAMLERNWIEAV